MSPRAQPPRLPGDIGPPPVDPPSLPGEVSPPLVPPSLRADIAPPPVEPPLRGEVSPPQPEPPPLRRLLEPQPRAEIAPPLAREPAPVVPQPRLDLAADYAALLKPKPKAVRLVSLDAYRGFIMLAMASGGLAIPQVVKVLEKTPAGQELLKQQPWWQVLAYHTDHVAWVGCSFWDLIQPAFMFMVGVALPYSVASRMDKGDAPWQIYGHALFRSVLLIALGIFLSSNGAGQTNYTFVNVLTQIGLGYFFLLFLVDRPLSVQALALAGILGGYWYWFYQYPLPAGFDYRQVGVPDDWKGFLPKLFAPWNKNANAAAHFDQWFLNLFPRATPYAFNSGGYQTLNFVPSLGTMLLGLMAGELLRSRAYSDKEKFIRLVLAGLACLTIGIAASYTVCPIVKRIWTPAWTVYSAAFTFWMLAAFYLVIDVWGWRRWSWFLVVVGMNSIAIYCMSQLMRPWLRQTLKTHLGTLGYPWVSTDFAPLAEAAGVLLVLWLICAWMYWKKLFIKI